MIERHPLDFGNLKLIHFSMVAGCALLLIVLNSLFEGIDFSKMDAALTSTDYLYIGIGILLMIASQLVPKIIRVETSKIAVLYIVQWALLEASIIILTFIHYFLGGHPVLMILALLGLVVLYLTKPKRISK